MNLCPHCGGSLPGLSGLVEPGEVRFGAVHSTVAPVNKDLAALVRKLSYSLRKASPGHTLPDQAMDFLRRHELIGSPLRDATAAPALLDEADARRAAMDVLAERQRQVEKEGWTPEHDDKHAGGEMADAAACYATAMRETPMPMDWPWDPKWWKPKDYRRNLIRAGALILAEIERIDRAAISQEPR